VKVELLTLIMFCFNFRLKELEDQYAKEKMEHERMFAQQREVRIASETFP